MSGSAPVDEPRTQARSAPVGFALPAALVCVLASLGGFAAPGSRRTLGIVLPLGVLGLGLAVHAKRRAPRSAWAAGALLLGLLVLGVELASILLARA